MLRGPICALVIVLSLVGCGGNDDRSKNADEFRAKVRAIDYAVKFEPESEIHPGLVIGKATTNDGISSSFALSFGPAPEKLLPKLEKEGTIWIDAGDEVNYWMERLPQSALSAQGNRVLDMQFAIEDIACRVVAGDECRY